MRIISSYLYNAQTNERVNEFSVSTRIPTVLSFGHNIMNILYNVLLTVPILKDLTLTVYTNDGAVIIIEKNDQALNCGFKDSMNKKQVTVLDGLCLTYAVHKIEVILFTGNRIYAMCAWAYM